MTPPPEWLPPFVSVDGEWEKVLRRLYSIFEGDFKSEKPLFNRMNIWWDNRVLEGGEYEEGFWHLISRDDKNRKERLFDPRRAERLPWCKPTLTHTDDDAVRVWDYKESNGRLRTYVWLKDFDYLIVLEKRRQRIGVVAFLISAFYVDGDSSRRGLRGKYEKRQS